jgi:hypothetical protein
VTFHNAAGTSANVQRSSPSPVQERKNALKAWQERGFLQGYRSEDRLASYTDDAVLRIAGQDALTMFRRGKRLGKEKRARES